MSRHVPGPRTDRQRSRILAAIGVEPMTAQQLADRLHLSRDGINIHLRNMKAEKPRLLHISAMLYNAKGGRPAPQYAPGDLPDATYKPSREPYRHLQAEQQAERARATLLAKPMATNQLAEVMGLCSGQARHYIAKLKASKQAYIFGWLTLLSGIAPLYAIGNHPDAPRPIIDGKTAYARKKAKRKVCEAARDQYAKELARIRINYRIKRLKAMPQNPFSALFMGGVHA